MYIRAAASAVEVWTPAKLNLFLEVLSRREDGFHEIETLMIPVSLFDTVYFQTAPRGETHLHIVFSGDWRSRSGKHSGREHHENPEGLDQQHIPEGAENLAVRAVELLRNHAGTKAGAALRLVKRIPPAAGLGGGSSDAAAALVAANAGWGLGYSLQQLMPLAVELGSDVPFFLAQAAAVCRGRGERVEPMERLGCHHFVVVRPPTGLSTAEVYGNCQAAGSPRNCHGVIESLRRGHLPQAGRRLFNRLQPAAEKLTPWITRLKEAFQWLDLPGHQMSGSGSSYFGLCASGRQARRAAARLRSRGWGNVYVVRGL